MSEPTRGFPPILGPHPRVLVLGSLPSRKSVELGQYYGHPQNAFWQIMGRLFGARPGLPYPERTAILVAHRLAVWDVLQSSVRPGSMDADIVAASVVPNDFETLFRDHPGIERVFLNGQTAARLYERHVAPVLEKGSNRPRYQALPSTSPAYASMNFDDKLRAWRTVSDAIDNKGDGQ